MKIWAFAILATVVLSASQSVADVGKTYLTAYDKRKGSQATAGKFGKQILLKRQAEIAKSKSSTRKAKTNKSAKSKATGKMPPNTYTEQVRYCGKSYYTTKRGKRWITAHTKARHALLVRYHQAKGKYKIVCGTKPKEPARKPIRKKAKPASKGS